MSHCHNQTVLEVENSQLETQIKCFTQICQFYYTSEIRDIRQFCKANICVVTNKNLYQVVVGVDLSRQSQREWMTKAVQWQTQIGQLHEHKHKYKYKHENKYKDREWMTKTVHWGSGEHKLVSWSEQA